MTIKEVFRHQCLVVMYPNKLRSLTGLAVISIACALNTVAPVCATMSRRVQSRAKLRGTSSGVAPQWIDSNDKRVRKERKT